MAPTGAVRAGRGGGRLSVRSRILVLTQVLPYPLDAGPKVRAYHVLRWLTGRADVHLASFVRPDDSPAAVDHLRAMCAGVHTVPLHRSPARDAVHLVRSLCQGTSFIIARDDVAAMRATIADLVGRIPFTAVHADQLWMAQHARDLPIPFKVLDNHNAVYRIFERLAVNEPSAVRRALYRREARVIARYEVAQIETFDHTLFVTEEDRAAMRAVAPDDAARRRIADRTSVIPICVDADAIAPIRLRRDAHRITVLGTMYWPPNIEGVMWFASHAFPHVLRAVPDAVLTVIGKNPPAAVRQLAERFPGSVEITGYVADPGPYLAETAAFAVPLLSGGGMRVKIIDAWAWALPVVSTAIGAEGIAVRPGTDALVADTPAGFAEACILLLTDPELRARVAAAGRAAVQRRYNVATAYRALEAIYAGVPGQPAPPAPDRPAHEHTAATPS